jgi:predicted heme/steroid binding protein
MRMMKRTYLAVMVLTALAALSGYFVWRMYSENAAPPSLQETQRETLRDFTANELSQYDGASTTLPIYIGLDGYVYDVTEGRRFYAPGAVYHYLAGKDSSKSLHIMGADIIKQKYPIIGILKPESVSQ